MPSFLSYDFPCGSLFNIPIRINILLPIVLVAQCALYATTGSGDNMTALLYAFIVYGPVLWLTVLIHELGHSLAARCVGGKAEKILLWPLGGLAYCSHDSGPKGDVWVTFAGPLTHIPQAAIWFVIGRVAGTWASFNIFNPQIRTSNLLAAVAVTAFGLNILLMLFNLLIPAYPLDGGRLLVDFLLIAGVPAQTTAYITISAAVMCAVALIILGILRVVFGIFAIFIGVFVLLATFELYQFVQKGILDQHPMFTHASTSSQQHQQQMPQYGP